ncbi:hypothetical protein DEH81_10500 [Pectobacterium zantedeschiae]|uniref:Uncharacterized protein n=1 Tax=Pectobacterium zantedeschiae TaxID=2034769 RepID=A0A9X8JII4_9GAMM|nr:hypothetical protein DEH81_10500 [Pectobacterium zantedeschiae]RYC43754.1 hypothetical protein CLR69_01500 [Pectobacterium zantedeschiae]RYC49025.1 hypothetical protein CTN06_06115 [Pectobacterium zantedeschiae]
MSCVVNVGTIYTRHTSSCMCVGCVHSPESLTQVSSSGFPLLPTAFLKLELFRVYCFKYERYECYLFSTPTITIFISSFHATMKIRLL